MLSRKMILKKLAEEKVDFGKTPERTFSYYRNVGLLPRPEIIKREAFYPDNTVEYLKKVRRLLSEGHSIKWIKAVQTKSGFLRRRPVLRTIRADGITKHVVLGLEGEPKIEVEVRRDGVICRFKIEGGTYVGKLSLEQLGHLSMTMTIEHIESKGDLPNTYDLIQYIWNYMNAWRASDTKKEA